jgi:hypothetical protein
MQVNYDLKSVTLTINNACDLPSLERLKSTLFNDAPSLSIDAASFLLSIIDKKIELLNAHSTSDISDAAFDLQSRFLQSRLKFGPCTFVSNPPTFKVRPLGYFNKPTKPELYY